jgi:hypothetical protein
LDKIIATDTNNLTGTLKFEKPRRPEVEQKASEINLDLVRNLDPESRVSPCWITPLASPDLLPTSGALRRSARQKQHSREQDFRRARIWLVTVPSDIVTGFDL